MIPLTKTVEPNSLRLNKAKWTKELLEAIAGGDKDEIRNKKKKYNQPDVKAGLQQETNDKCAYCESKIVVVAYGDIEHVTPKAVDPTRTFEWANLTFACQICNGKKSDKENIVDPYLEPVTDMFFFVGPFMRGRTEAARLSEKELTLNRVKLLEDRSEHLKVLSDALESIANEPNHRLRELAFEAIDEDLDLSRVEYVSMKRSALNTFKNG
jgi:hypothetical protein